ncbi:PEP-CTERM sorting domain-containing protein [Glacieibacterium frigidum]|uniref:PEP-CTERM sorting domain-containing protein n=2 Tax=Glacieibacterium frigidum TaxID=2593303 RepID=A0A552UJP4_9SPHN|nr:PEP-CTERM sorting domain-containing protein [Glacieibacterium frigidum]
MQVFGGTSILVTVGPALNDLNDYCWPDFGAFVTGTAEIFLELSEYDPDLQVEVLVRTTSVGAGEHMYLSGGSNDMVYGLYTSGRFFSAESFTMDALALGLPNIAPGIPEPATWALLITGFGLTGTALRRRRGVAA